MNFSASSKVKFALDLRSVALILRSVALYLRSKPLKNAERKVSANFALSCAQLRSIALILRSVALSCAPFALLLRSERKVSAIPHRKFGLSCALFALSCA